MRQYVLPLVVANTIALATIGASYLAYSRILSAAEFGIYSTALAVGAFAVLILDSGIRTVIIKRKEDLSADECGALLVALIAIAILLGGLMLLARQLIPLDRNSNSHGIAIVMGFAAIYLASYPWISVSTALLERSLSYSKLAWIESVGVGVERGSPAALLFLTHLGLASFVYGLLAGRIIRLIWLQLAAPVSPTVSRHTFQSIRHMFAEGTWFQIASGASWVRDNLHVLLIGPLCGTSWVGYYGWAIQVCSIASQLFVQISARISLPLTARAANATERWAIIMQQARTLSATTAPVLAAVVIGAPLANRWLFASKWTPALPLLSLLCLRMLPGIASTSLGPFLLVERGTKRYAFALWAWTAVEVVAAIAAIGIFGSTGLAYSYSVTTWIGIAIIIGALQRDAWVHYFGLAEAMLERPAVWIAILFGICGFALRNNSAYLSHWYSPIAAIGILGLAATLADRELRGLIVPTRFRPSPVKREAERDL